MSSPNLERNRRWQAKQKAAGNCVLCGKPAVPGRTRCERHAAMNRAYMAKYHAE